MKIVASLLSLALLFTAAFASAKNANRGTVSYRACVKLLKLTPQKQAVVAAKAKIPLEEAVESCQEIKRQGLVAVRKAAVELRHFTRAGGLIAADGTIKRLPAGAEIGDDGTISYRIGDSGPVFDFHLQSLLDAGARTPRF